MRSSFVLIILLVAVLLGIYFTFRPRLAPGQAPLKDIQIIETLRTQFNQDVGQTRLIVLVSPTWSTCLAGARWVQSQVLAQNPSAQLRVYAVWLPMLWSDSREMWNGTTMPDNRVVHFWDGERVIGEWFAKQVDGYDGISWDTYYLYGPDAVWETAPSPMVSSGGTIYDEREALQMQMNTLLKKWVLLGLIKRFKFVIHLKAVIKPLVEKFRW